jgi:hypothetical protein
MDEIEFLVEETYRHHENLSAVFSGFKTNVPAENSDEILTFPESAGIIYHIQKSQSVFVLRTFVSTDIRQDYLKIIQRPEDYPSLRLLEDEENEIEKKLKFFIVQNPSEAEIIHDQLHNRRFPIFEEMLCNISDPGFSWWLSKKSTGFQLAFTMSVFNDESTVKLGPLGDREIAIRKFQNFAHIINSVGIKMNIQNEINRVQFTGCEEFILEELKDLFEFGVVTRTFEDLFKILSKQTQDLLLLEETWFYLHELAAMRRFWIQIQYDLNSGSVN